MRVCLPVCLPICLPVFEIWANKLKICSNEAPNHQHHYTHAHITSSAILTETLSRHLKHTHTHTRAYIVVSDYISDRSRMSQTCMKHFTGGPELCSWDARFVVLSSLRPRVCQGCQQSELMLSYWWMIISTNDFTSKAHRRNSDAIFEYYYHLQPLESLGHLANVTMEKDVKKGLTPLIYNLL